ncbi:DMT family transporter [Lentibacter sp. XHP0401]|jgi:drug/metabolite transporter (DMT)-like permease|uniref:DMT family transporter n=1 Tax=Lentibacter sp. XHP0401 TaxID=2984334 RepID=UPI0021E6DA32|nr:DMT family transporter [Lentibacter sp. XHP0401]MCV2891489.1 DMT family transporter [Lentibacter sp. XHP0401]
MSFDKPLLGIALMLGFCIIAPLGDAIAKLIGQSVALGPMLLVRFGVQVLLLLPFIALSLRPWLLSPRALRLCFLRTVLHMAGIGLMFTALRHMPLADAIAIVFVLPFINLVLGRFILGETVGPARLGACVVGFVGTLFVIQPSFAEVGWFAILPLMVAFLFSGFMLITRHIAHETDPIGLQFVSGIMATVMILPLFALGAAAEFAEFTWTLPDIREWSLLLSVGALGTLAHLLMTWSLRYAPSATVTPIQYVEIPIAALIGLLIFAELPNALAAFGMSLTIAAGLFTMLFEEANRRRSLRALPEPVPMQSVAE